MPERNQMKFIELLCSKLCHDLISPIGAINNGLEFLEQSDSNTASEAMDLVRKSSSQAADKLAYYRIALGSAGSKALIEIDTVIDLVEKLSSEKNIKIIWSGTESYAQSKIDRLIGKLILNLALIFFESLSRSGRVQITFSKDIRTPEITMSVMSDNWNLHKDVKTVLESDISDDLLTVRNVLAYHSKQLALECSKSIVFQEKSKGHIVIKVI